MPFPFLVRFLATLFLLSPFLAQSQTTIRSYAVEVSVTLNPTPGVLEFHWPAVNNVSNHNVYRKSLNNSTWGSIYRSLSGTDTSFSDTLAPGEAYEYRISRSGSGYTGNGYIYAGYEVPATEDRGTLVLLVDSSQAQPLASEIGRLKEDLEGDGWMVNELVVSPNETAVNVRSLIQTLYNADPNRVKAVFVLGHVPVPYSGRMAPDGHTNNHLGAWPADVYYGEMNTTWADFSVNETSGSRSQNHNVPNDGKFDHNTLPSPSELWVGRVDFANMPAFSKSETDLLRAYLDKDHAWRHKAFTVPEKAVIDDNFGVFGGEAFAANGWRNFGPLIGAANVMASDLRNSLNSSGHLWAYGCGGGSYTSAGGIGNTNNFASDSLQGVFSMLFGSYHGDWDSNNNFMRAIMAASGSVLSCAWAGRPHWHFHHMGLGMPIGYSAWVTQNNFNVYFSSSFARSTHIALLGDPTLRQHVLAPAASLAVSSHNGSRDMRLTWTASADSVSGYYVYRQDTAGQPFFRVSNTVVSGNSFVDGCVPAGTHRYMVRAVELREGSSGSYYNLSQGIFGAATGGASFSLQTDSLTSPLCAGELVNVGYSISPNACMGNVFRVELSDANGSFANPDSLTSMTDTVSGSLAAMLPANLPPGTGYRIRVVSTNPAQTGTDNGTDLDIQVPVIAGFTYQTRGDTLLLTNTTQNASAYTWDFGDGSADSILNPVHVYTTQGSFQVMLIAQNDCFTDTFSVLVNTVSLTPSSSGGIQATLLPNPAHQMAILSFSTKTATPVSVSLSDLNGRVLKTFNLPPFAGRRRIPISLRDFAQGMYFLTLQTSQSRLSKRLLIQSK